jgi:hypothetical protein
MPGRIKQNKTKFPQNRHGIHALQVETLTMEHTKDNRLTVYLVDITSANHHHRIFPRGLKHNLLRKTEQNFQQMFPRRKPAQQWS